MGLVGYSAAKVLIPAFYALHDARTPMLISFGSIVVNFCYGDGDAARREFGTRRTGAFHVGRGDLQRIALFILMRNRVGGIYGRNLWSTFLRVSAASALMGARFG